MRRVSSQRRDEHALEVQHVNDRLHYPTRVMLDGVPRIGFDVISARSPDRCTLCWSTWAGGRITTI